MNVLIVVFRVLLLVCVAAFMLGWLGYACMLVRFVFSSLFGGFDLHANLRDPKLLLLRSWLNRAWWGGLLTGIFLVVLAYIREYVLR